MHDTTPTTPPSVRWFASGRFANRGPNGRVLAGIAGVARRVALDTWYLPPASIAA